MNRGRQLHGIAVPADVHVEGRRFGAQQVVVDACDLKTAGQELCHRRVDFGAEQNKVAHHHYFIAHRLERRPATQREGRFERDTVERHLQIGARKTVAVNVAGNDGAPTQLAVDFLPVHTLSIGQDGESRGCGNSEQLHDKHGALLHEPRLFVMVVAPKVCKLHDR